MKLGVKYVGPLAAFSGYGEANRNFVCALDAVGIDLTTEILQYDNNKENYFGHSYNLVLGKQGKNIQYDIKIVHVPGDSYVRYLEPCKFHIGHLFWETDRMSSEWVWNCNLMDEIWTGSQYNKEAFERSGIKVPIWIFPQPVDTQMVNPKLSKWRIVGHEDEFLFYSIFQWIERKSPDVLIEAFLREFTNKEKVGLLIKTYRERFLESEKQNIRAQIQEHKYRVNKTDAPPIHLSVELMDKHDVCRIHKTGDCFVLPHRGEGWCRPIVEAMLFCKPVIATNLGGIHDFLPKETYLPLAYNKKNVFNMKFAPWYREDQIWGDVSVDELRQKLRWVYEHREEAKEIAERGRKFVEANFSFEVVGRMLKDRLIDIQKHIDSERRSGLSRWLPI